MNGFSFPSLVSPKIQFKAFKFFYHFYPDKMWWRLRILHWPTNTHTHNTHAPTHVIMFSPTMYFLLFVLCDHCWVKINSYSYLSLSHQQIHIMLHRRLVSAEVTLPRRPRRQKKRETWYIKTWSLSDWRKKILMMKAIGEESPCGSHLPWEGFIEVLYMYTVSQKRLSRIISFRTLSNFHQL